MACMVYMLRNDAHIWKDAVKKSHEVVGMT